MKGDRRVLQREAQMAATAQSMSRPWSGQVGISGQGEVGKGIRGGDIA